MRVEIDQSVKIEQKNRETIIGLSNGKKFTVAIPSKVKMRLQDEFRKAGKPKLFRIRTFAAGVVLLLKHAKIPSETIITIDREYYGKERVLKSMLLEMWSRFSDDDVTVGFNEIGRRSPAHVLSYETMKKKRRVDKILTYAEMEKLALK